MRPVTITLRPDGGGSVWLGEHDVSDAVQALRVTAEARSGHRVELDLAVFVTTVEGEATIGLPKRTEDALVALGWTPPPAETGPGR